MMIVVMMIVTRRDLFDWRMFVFAWQDWKVRKAAYQQVQTLFQQAQSEDSDVFRDYGEMN